MNTYYRQGYIEGKSERITTYASLKESYDLILVASSWDSRSISITEARDVRAELSIVLLFDTRDEEGLRDRHDISLQSYCRDVSKDVVLVSGQSTNVEDIWTKLIGHIVELAKSLRRPLSVLLDLSTCPRYYAAGVVATCFKQGIASRITVVYAEGTYPKQSEVTFTKGRWRTVSVPGLDGCYDPSRSRFFLVSVGWEGWKMLRAVSRADPDRVSMLFPDPGFEPDYVEMAEKQSRELVERYHVPQEQIVRAHAGDAISAWRKLGEASLERLESENIAYLMTGTKPHALALALRALVVESPTVLYVVPDEHSVLRISPRGVYWRYDLRDVTVHSR